MMLRTRPFRTLLVALAGAYLGSAAGIWWLILDGWLPGLLGAPAQTVVLAWAAAGGLLIWLAVISSSPLPALHRTPQPRW